MNDIYVNAILRSRINDTQYVIEKSLDLLLVDNKINLLNYLKNGWNIKGKYHNGVGYYSYRIDDEATIGVLSNYLKSKHKIYCTSVITTIYFSFQEFFDRSAKSEGMNVDVTIWNTSKKRHTNYRLENEQAKDIYDFIVSCGLCGLNISQDKYMLIREIEVNIKNGKLMCNNAI